MDLALVKATFYDKGEKLPDKTIATEPQLWYQGKLWKKGLSDKEIKAEKQLPPELAKHEVLVQELIDGKISEQEYYNKRAKLPPYESERASDMFGQYWESKRQGNTKSSSKKPSLLKKMVKLSKPAPKKREGNSK